MREIKQTKRFYAKGLAIKLLTATATILLLQSCKLDEDFCKLTKNDKKFVLEKYDYLKYLENGTTEVTVKIETEFKDSWNVDGSWFYTGKGGYETATSGFFLPDSSLFLKIISSACFTEARVYLWQDYYSSPTSKFDFSKDSITGITKIIQNVEYDNCYVFSDTIDVKELVYVKGHGIVKLKLLNGYLIELLSKE